jgi:uncharacterized damage-inducible protein DinB
MPAPPPPNVDLLLALLDESYDHKAWHGPTLRGALRRVTAAQAAWRPAPRRHNIAEIAVHAAYWKYAVRRRLRGDRRGSFPLTGSNWFRMDRVTEDAWRQACDLLDDQHRQLRETVAALSPHMLVMKTRRTATKTPPLRLIYGAAMHDVYHAGQIQTLNGLQRG